MCMQIKHLQRSVVDVCANKGLSTNSTAKLKSPPPPLIAPRPPSNPFSACLCSPSGTSNSGLCVNTTLFPSFSVSKARIIMHFSPKSVPNMHYNAVFRAHGMRGRQGAFRISALAAASKDANFSYRPLAPHLLPLRNTLYFSAALTPPIPQRYVQSEVWPRLRRRFFCRARCFTRRDFARSLASLRARQKTSRAVLLR